MHFTKKTDLTIKEDKHYTQQKKNTEDTRIAYSIILNK